tara:strand:- start:62 stop:1441 length:1380 start_codon:yes stop_codon:yes gene_type:complete
VFLEALWSFIDSFIHQSFFSTTAIMKKYIVLTCASIAIIGLVFLGASHAQELSPSQSTPKGVPSNRADMLKALDRLKYREARLPLPPANEDSNLPVSNSSASTSIQSGGRTSMGVVNNGRMRNLYLPPELQIRGGRYPAVSDQGLPYDFSTELFWIVSRVNNCHYCLGHQEHKLKSVGVTEPTLLALDSDWSAFPEKQRAAFAFTRQLTLAPHTITDRDIDALRVHFSEEQILDMAFTVGRYNATNRWTDSLGIPQEEQREFVSTLDPQVASTPSQVAPVGFPKREKFDDYTDWLAEFERQSTRQPRLSMASFEPHDGIFAHEQLLSEIPAAGPAFVEQLHQARIVGQIPVGLRDQIAYVAAREDQAWYMQNVSRTRLLAEGLSDHEIFQLTAGSSSSGAQSVALQFVKKLTTHPQSMTDQDIQNLSHFYSSEQIAEIVYHTGLAATLNRVTEVVCLGW